MKRTLITSALPYANGYIHLGHAAGAYLPADIYARFLRLNAEEVLYVCGSDENGVAITISAEKEKVKPKDIIYKYHNSNKLAFDKFGMSFDIYSRTSIPEHHETAREFFADFLKKGYLVEKEEEQFYDVKAGMFLPDRYVEGECPNCGHDKARGDQCDNCGAYYNQIELKNPISTVSGEKPIVKTTNHWYLQFDKFEEFLNDYVSKHESEWKDNVIQQTKSWLKQGLTERAMTRDLNWGVTIKGIEGITDEKAEGKVLYVWFDAVLGYISATKEWSKLNNQEWKKWWQDNDTRYIAFIGKDNIVFHTIIFPVMLHGKGEFILPDNVPANEFLNLEGKKFSKSRNWSIDLKDFYEDFKEEQWNDSLRYTLAMNFPETRDSDFTWKDFQARNNNELAAILGNFVNRAVVFLHKSFDGKIPELSGKFEHFCNDWTKLCSNETEYNEFAEKYGENDATLIKSLIQGIDKVANNYRKFRFRDAITESMNIARAANKYFNDEEPWKSVKSDNEKAAKTLNVCLQLVRSLGLIFAPVLPYTSKQIGSMLNIEAHFGNIRTDENMWQEAKLPSLISHSEIKKIDVLFSRLEDDQVKIQQDKLGEKVEEQENVNDPLITIDDFMKVKFRTATIIAAEKIKKSKKLLKLHVDTGKDQRQIIAGIAEHYEPEYLIGKTIVIVANLQPAKLMGQESNGMMLAASTEDGKLCFVTPECDKIKAGAEVR